MIKKIFLLALLLALFNFSFAQGPLDLKHKVKELLAARFSKLLGAPVSVGEIEGDLYKKIILRNVKITDSAENGAKVLLYTDKIEIDYDLKRVLLDKIDLLPNIKKIKIYQPYIDVARDRKGFWPLQQKFTAGQEQKNTFDPLGLDMKIEIVGGRVKYSDARGWGDEIVVRTFETEVRDFAGIINIKNEDVQLSVTALLPGAKRYNNLTFKGNFDLINYKYNFEMNTEDIDLSKWVWYTAPFPEWDVNKGSADVRILLSNSQAGRKIDNKYQIIAQVSRANFVMPEFLKKESRNLFGKVTVDNDSVVFSNIRGFHESLPVTLNGKLFVADKEISDMRLALSVSAVPLLKAKEYFPELPIDLPQVAGQADIELLLTGSPHKIKAAGQFISDKITYQKYSAEQLLARFNYANFQTRVNIEKAAIFDGAAKGQIELNFKENKNGKMSLQSKGALQVENILAAALAGQPEIAGRFSGNLFFEAAKDKIDLYAVMPSASLTAYEQKVSSFNVKIAYTPQKTILEKIAFDLNGETVMLKGQINKDNFQLMLKDQLVVLATKSPLKYSDNIINFSGLFNGTIAGGFNSLESLTAELQVKINRLPLFYEFIDKGVLNLKLKDQKININKAELFFADSYLAFDLNYDLLKNDLRLLLAPGSKVAFTDITFLQELAPGSVGQLFVAGELGFLNGRPLATAEIELKNFEYNDVAVDNMKTELTLNEDHLILNKAVVDLGDGLIKGDVSWLLNNMQLSEQRTAGLDYLKVKTEDVQLAELQLFLNTVIREASAFDKRIQESGYFKKVELAIEPQRFDLLNNKLYLEDEKKDVLAEYLLFTALPLSEQHLAAEDFIDGSLNGFLEIEKQVGQWSVLGQLSVADGRLFKNKFSGLQLNMKTDKNNKINGEITLTDLNIADKVSYKKINTKLEYADGFLSVQELDLETELYSSQQVLTGSFPLAAFWDKAYINEPLDLKLNLKSADLRLFSGFFDNIQDLTAEGEISLSLSGTFSHPEIAAEKIELSGTTIYFKEALYPALTIKRADLSLSKNKLQVNNFEFFLAEPAAAKATPVFKIFGSAQLSLAGFDQEDFSARAEVALFAKDMADRIVLKDIYEGDFYLKNLKLEGVFSSDQAAQLVLPKLSGQIGINRGEIYFKKIAGKKTTAGFLANLPLELRLELNNSLRVKSDASLFSGEALNVLSQIDLALAPRGSILELRGTAGKPLLDGSVFFDEGQLSLFYRRFILLSREEQQRYFSAARHVARENQIEFKTDENGNFSQNVFLVAQSIIVEAAEAVTGAVLVTENLQEDEVAEIVYQEKEYLAIINGSLTDLASFSFEKYSKENNRYVLEGEPYVLKNKETGENIDPYRFQLLMADLAPSLLKSAYAYAAGSGDYEQGTKEATREFMISQGAVVWRYIMRPVERTIADTTGLYDVRITRDLSGDAARLLDIENQVVLNEDGEEEFIKGENIIGFELVHEVVQNRLYMSVDTDVDRNTKLKSYNLMVNSYSLTWKIIRDLFLDEISLNVGNEYDYYQKQYKPVLSLEALHSF